MDIEFYTNFVLSTLDVIGFISLGFNEGNIQRLKQPAVARCEPRESFDFMGRRYRCVYWRLPDQVLSVCANAGWCLQGVSKVLNAWFFHFIVCFCRFVGWCQVIIIYTYFSFQALWERQLSQLMEYIRFRLQSKWNGF